ncbi:MAG: CDP-glucose 4,6-dehydratase [Peptococcaceae bacterium BRH_c4a]|nr:MAG: CDP-glucose 4,6-dehydratase [Peptococcaceae bacterium BRH_c4a]
MFSNVYNNRRVLITGHTGFKGSWLALWLYHLGAEVTGLSLYIPSQPCNFEVLKLESKINHLTGDIRDYDGLKRIFDKTKPEIVFHLAAQPIVRKSYEDPAITFDTNIGGAVNIMECIKSTPGVQAAVIITSDKCYNNVEWPWGYREIDSLGGEDPYSASKACVEIVSNSYIKSFFSGERSPRVSTTRAGNVIGGGDWAVDRIIPDFVRALSRGEKLLIRSPYSTRPWQHVLEPLSGYLWLGSRLMEEKCDVTGEPFNFGPQGEVVRTVEELIQTFAETWGHAEWFIPQGVSSEKKESTLLKLNCDKALHYLKWHAVLSFEETVRMTAEWYKAYYKGDQDMNNFTKGQIEEYFSFAKKQGLAWTR